MEFSASPGDKRVPWTAPSITEQGEKFMRISKTALIVFIDRFVKGNHEFTPAMPRIRTFDPEIETPIAPGFSDRNKPVPVKGSQLK